ncbi:MAG: CPBP family intramembrane metalloprotease [Myxococcales bacterium]|nr:CPBP family intramembrane metalloprotease [Myxococcales bacterium]MCB9581722.1 CPBP family intramembrane metalloprotease [Polyangiaceae bacterium]
MALIVFPPFWLGWLYWWHPHQAFHPAPPPSFSQDVLGQLLVIALPEEAFYRGYLQTSFDDAFRGRVRVLGAELGPGILIASALFALGHIATEVHPNRLAVFFPALVFGWLRVRTRGIGAGMVFHALSNLLTAYLAHSYMLGR